MTGDNDILGSLCELVMWQRTPLTEQFWIRSISASAIPLGERADDPMFPAKVDCRKVSQQTWLHRMYVSYLFESTHLFVHKLHALAILVYLRTCNNNIECNGGICEYQDNDYPSTCIGCPPGMTGPFCECKIHTSFFPLNEQDVIHT